MVTGEDEKWGLVASGDTAACQIIGSVLKRNGFRVREVSDGHRVVEEIADVLFRVVFLDIMLPNVSGMQIFQVIRHIPGMKIVMLVKDEQSFEAMISNAREQGAFGPLTHPVIPAKVEEILRETGVT